VPDEFENFEEFKNIWEPLFMLETYYSLTNMDGSGTKAKTTGKGWNCSLDFDDEDQNYIKVRMWEPNGKFEIFSSKGRMEYKESDNNSTTSPIKEIHQTKGKAMQTLREEGWLG